MPEGVEFSLSSRYRAAYPQTPFGLTLVTGVTPTENPPGFDQHKRQLLRKMRAKDRLPAITGRIDAYDAFFRSFGYDCPLPKHLKRTVNSGFPRYNLIVDAHFLAEMCAGILVAVADRTRFDGALTLDLAGVGETCLGLGAREFALKEGEIVLRDEKDVVCVLCQGADEKTRVNADTREALFYAFGIPGIEPERIAEGLEIAAEALVAFGNGTARGVSVY
jgi:DNA/RNA-binding domain of Phe-tRNA-synthetase-like protein